MNLFNCFQAMGFYTALPFGAMWLSNNGYAALAWIAGIVWLAGYVVVTLAVNESDMLK